MTCRYEGCKNIALPGQSRCADHPMRWALGKPVEREPLSPWVRNARAGRLPAKAVA